MKVSFTEVAYILLSVLYLAAIWGIISYLRDATPPFSPTNIVLAKLWTMVLGIFLAFLPAAVFFINFVNALLRRRLIFPYIVVLPTLMPLAGAAWLFYTIVRCFISIQAPEYCSSSGSGMILFLVIPAILATVIAFTVTVALAKLQIQYSKRQP